MIWSNAGKIVLIILLLLFFFALINVPGFSQGNKSEDNNRILNEKMRAEGSIGPVS